MKSLQGLPLRGLTVLAFVLLLNSIRSSLANSSRDDLPHTAPPTTGPDPPGQGGAPLPARQQPASSSNRPGAPLSAISISERRAFLEQALLVHQPNPASRRRLSSSKLVEADQTEDPEEVCAICLEDCSAASSASTSPTSHNGSGGGKALCRSFNSRCQHVFHRDCILDWLVHDETCPCCRQPFLEFYDDADADADAAGETDDDNTTAVASLEEEGDDDGEEGDDGEDDCRVIQTQGEYHLPLSDISNTVEEHAAEVDRTENTSDVNVNASSCEVAAANSKVVDPVLASWAKGVLTILTENIQLLTYESNQE